MSNFTKAIKTLMEWIGHDKRSGDDRRAPITSNRKTTKRKNVRRKK